MSLDKYDDEFKNQAFEFAVRIAPVYKLLKWTWYGDKKHLPTARDIYENLLDLWCSLKANDGINVGSGGLTVSHDKDDGLISIEFTKSKEIYKDAF